MKLSLCAVVKNEADQLAEFLEAIQFAVDEIIIVDTGSTDKTVDIAQQHSCKIFPFSWQDDFAAARNFSLKQASGDWILILDADERIASEDIHSLRQLMDTDDVSGYRLAIRSYMPALSDAAAQTRCNGEYPEEKEYPAWSRSYQTRLFRRDPRITFSGEVYETVDHALYANNLIVETSEIPIHHYGLCIDAQLQRARGAFYVKLGYKKIQSYPDSSQAYFELASNLLTLNETNDAIDVLLQAITIDASRQDVWEMLGTAYQKQEDYHNALSSFEKAAQHNPHNPEILNHTAEILLETGNHDKALSILEEALFINPKNTKTLYNAASTFYTKQHTDTALEFVNRLLEIDQEHYRGIVLKAQILSVMNEQDKAIIWFYEALRLKPDYYAPYYYLASIHLNQGDNAEAVDLLEKAWELSQHHYKIGTDLAQLFISQKNFIEAEQILSDIVQAHPEHQPSVQLLDSMHKNEPNR